MRPQEHNLKGLYISAPEDVPNLEMTSIQIDISTHTLIRGSLPSRVDKYLADRLTFVNPQWEENEKYGYWQGDTPEYLSYLTETSEGLLVPRGVTHRLLKILDFNHVEYAVNDHTRALKEVFFKFKGQLYPYQKNAVTAAAKRRYGVLELPTGAGKTVCALYLIAQRKQPALVICHSKELLYQWRDRAVEFLDLPEKEIGLIGDGKKVVGDRMTIGIVNSIYKKADEIKDRIGFLLIDECHRIASRTFTQAVTCFDSRFLLGLSATPYRRDKLTKLIYFFLGDKVFSIDPKTLQKANKIMRPKLVVRETDFNYWYQDDYGDMISALTLDPDRNRMIARDVLKETNGSEGTALIISDRVEHCQVLYGLIKGKRSIRILTGDIPSKDRKKIVEELNQGKVRVLVATSQLIGEGFDLKGLSSIFLACPIKFTGRVKQYTGRILRIGKGKRKAIIYDYLDEPGVLQASFKSRTYAYRELGVE